MRKKRTNNGQPGGTDTAARADATEDAPAVSSAGNGMVLLGRIVAAQGLKGEVKILTFTELPENIAAYGPLSDGKGATFRIDDLRLSKGEAVIARLAGINDRTAAERLRGTELYVATDSLPAPDKEEWYYRDLIGMQAVTAEGAPFGEVVSVQNFGAGDLLEFRAPEARHTFFLAFTLANVPTVDIKARQIIVVPPEEEIARPEEEGAAEA